MCEELLAERCAPTMAGLKTSSLFPCPKEDRAELLAGIRALNARLVPKGLRILPVKTVGDRELLYIYRPARLRRESDFPYEVGLFLGYPPRDVEGFIREKARRAKCTGAWKVYGDEEAARKGGFQRELQRIKLSFIPDGAAVKSSRSMKSFLNKRFHKLRSSR